MFQMYQEHALNTTEILHLVFSYCTIETIVRSSEVTVHWHKVINQNSYWRYLTDRDITVIVKPKRARSRKNNVH